jgi:hypothetical protein
VTPVGLSVGMSDKLGHKVGRLLGDSCGVISRHAWLCVCVCVHGGVCLCV